MFITRQEAISALAQLSESGILSEELESAIDGILFVIETEDTHHLSLWGAEDQASLLFTAVREDLITPELTARIDDLYNTYAMK